MSFMMFMQNSNTSARILENAWTVKDVTWQSINNIVASIVERLPYILAGFLVLGIFYVLARLAKRIFWSASGRTKLDHRLRILFSRLLVVFIVLVGVFTSMTVIVKDLTFSSLITGLGFTSFVIGFATKDILSNLLSGVLILWQQPFRIGDYLFVGSNQGKVEYIGVRATQLRKDDGELILIPNGDMYSSALTIRGAGASRRMNLKLSVGYESDLEGVKQTIKNAMRNVEGVVPEPQANVYVTDLSSSGVELAIYFWINTNEAKPMEVFDRVATEIKNALSHASVEVYPPSTVIVQNAETQLEN
jgi:small conductance mechanosensitive channel